MTTVILVRHGETEANVMQVWHGALDAPLTEKGRAQVAAVAQRLKPLSTRHPIDAFYVSPLPRAQSTAAAIAAVIGLEPTVVPDLREFDLGDWEGRTFQDLHDSEQLWQRWSVDPYFAPPNGESPRSFARRAMMAMQDLAQRHPRETVLVVTHGGVIAQILANWLGAGPDDWRRWEPENCSISILTRQDATWLGTAVNDVSHLPPDQRGEFDTPAYSEGLEGDPSP